LYPNDHSNGDLGAMFAKCDHRNQETAPTLITMDVTDANAALNPGLIPISLQALGMQNVEA
jgi:hypothetical protein